MNDFISASPTLAHTRQLAWDNLPSGALHGDADIRRTWDWLNEGRGNLPFLSADAIVAALDIFGTGRERLLVGREGASVAAMFLLAPQGRLRLRWSTFQPSQIPLGAWVASPRISLTALATSLIDSPLSLCLALSITQVDPRFTLRQADTARAQHDDYIETGWVEIDGSFEEYWEARGKNLRQNLRKQRAKLQACGIATSMLVIHEADQMQAAIARYGDLESSGWKAKIGTAIHSTNEQGRFYRRLLEEAALRGEAAIYEYHFGERVVAMNLCLKRDGVVVVLKTTYDESIKHYSPAFLLREDELKTLFAAGQIVRLEYYGPLKEWHTKWTANHRTLFHLTVFRWPLIKSLAALWRRRSGGLFNFRRYPGP